MKGLKRRREKYYYTRLGASCSVEVSVERYLSCLFAILMEDTKRKERERERERVSDLSVSERERYFKSIFRIYGK